MLVGRRESRINDRLSAWLPSILQKADRWRPRHPKDDYGNGVAIACQAGKRGAEVPQPLLANRAVWHETLQEACLAALERGHDVLWLRPGVMVTEHAWKRLREVCGWWLGRWRSE